MNIILVFIAVFVVVPIAALIADSHTETPEDTVARLVRAHEETMRRQYSRNSDNRRGYKCDHTKDLETYLKANNLYETYLKMYKA